MHMRKKLLTILPDTKMCEDFHELISSRYEIIQTGDEETGLRILRRMHEKLTAVLVDFDQSKKNDFDFIRKVSGNLLYASIPVIVIIPRPPSKEDLDCLDAGAIDIITLPCHEKLLLQWLTNAIRAKDSSSVRELERMLKALPSNIYVKDEQGRYLFCTRYWDHFQNQKEPGWTIRGKTDPEVRKDRKNAIRAHEADLKLLATGRGTRYTIRIDEDFYEIIKEPIKDETGNITGIIGLVSNVTEQEILKQELEKNSRTDALTGLYNRGYYQEYAGTFCVPGSFPMALITADCNGLKIINDTYGHLIGDEYIRMTSILFRTVLPENSIMFRTGGDEFILLIPDTDEETARKYIQNMKDTSQLFQVHDKKLSVAFGVSVLKDENDTLTECYEVADKEMYEDKKRTKEQRAERA